MRGGLGHGPGAALSPDRTVAICYSLAELSLQIAFCPYLQSHLPENQSSFPLASTVVNDTTSTVSR